MSGPPEPGPEAGDPACWAHEFEELLFGEPAAEPDAGAEGDEGDGGDRPAAASP